jgi:tripeptidyl-peptidase-1
LTAVRTPEWSLPVHLHEHISTIQPTNSFFGPRKSAPLDKRASEAIAEPALDAETLPPLPDAGTVAEVCNVNLVTPTCIRTLYGTINYTVQAADKNTMALNNFLGEVNLRSDARLDLLAYRPEAVSGADTFQQISINGGTVQQTPLNETQLEDGTGIEGALDVQAMLGIAWPTPLIAYSTGGSPPFQPDLFTTDNTNEPYVSANQAWCDQSPSFA